MRHSISDHLLNSQELLCVIVFMMTFILNKRIIAEGGERRTKIHGNMRLIIAKKQGNFWLPCVQSIQFSVFYNGYSVSVYSNENHLAQHSRFSAGLVGQFTVL